MSYEDFSGSSAWADTSPSGSPSLADNDIWGRPKASVSSLPDLSPGGFGAVQSSHDRSTGDLTVPRPENDNYKWNEETLGSDHEVNAIDGAPDAQEGEPEQGGFRTPTEVETPSSPVTMAAMGQGSTTAVTNGHSLQNAEDDFGDDDFDFAPPAAAPFDNNDTGGFDDFDDFGDFDEAVAGPSGSFDDVNKLTHDAGRINFVDEPDSMDEVWEDPDRSIPPRSLSLDPRNLPSKADLREQISALLAPTFPILSSSPPFDKRTVLTDEPIRQIEGLNQILFDEESRAMYAQLITLPVLKPLDWKRSRVRREQLISLGVPVNLDEVDSHRLSALPPLRITTNAQAGPGPNSATSQKKSKLEKAAGLKPEFNRERCGKLLSYREDQLSLVPPKYLARMQEDLVRACSEASSMLAWLREVKEVRLEESKRRNETIAGLIASAQRHRANEISASSGGLFRKGSVKRSGSGSQTPKRLSSPVIGR